MALLMKVKKTAAVNANIFTYPYIHHLDILQAGHNCITYFPRHCIGWLSLDQNGINDAFVTAQS